MKKSITLLTLLGLFGSAQAQLNLSPSVSQADCNNTCAGSANVYVTGGQSPYTYSWSNGNTTATATGLCAGNSYTVTVTDANSVTASTSITLSTQLILGTHNVTNTTCQSCCDGTDTIVPPTGGCPPYLYMWGPPDQFMIAQNYHTGLCAGTHTVVISDMCGCMAYITSNIGVGISTDVQTVSADETPAILQEGTQLHVRSSKDIDRVELFDLQGRMLKTVDHPGTDVRIDLADLPQAPVLVNVYVNGVKSAKMVARQ